VKLAVSNIAWASTEDAQIADLLWREHVRAIEIAPTTWRERPLEAPAADVIAWRRSWNERGIELVALQSLLFGRPDLRLFASEASRAAMLDHLRRTIDFAATVGARALVFGSPKNRLRGDVGVAEATGIARDFLRAVGEYAHDRGTVLCIEANPPEYGCDFITTTAEAVELCRLVDHPGVGVNGDLGGMTLSSEDVGESIALAAPVLAHFHISEPRLAETGTAAADHAEAALALRAIGYEGWLSIEMRAAGGGANVAAVARAIARAKSDYLQGESAHRC
jgi:sugar phosphate isomerase/epimerase